MTTPAQPPERGRNRKGMLSNPVTWVIVLGVALAGGAFLLWRRRNTAANANASTAAAPSTEDFAGQIATLQSEIADLQSSFAQGEGAEKGTGTGGGGGGTDGSHLAAPSGLSITPHPGFADFGWNTVPGAKAYELQVAGSGGKGTGASHFDHAGAGNHAENVRLANGAYRARVRAGTSVTSLSGPWTAWKPFVIGKAAGGGGHGGGGHNGSSGGGGETEDSGAD